MSFESWMERLRNQAFSKGISVDTLQNTFLKIDQLDLKNKPEQILYTPSAHQNNLTFSTLLMRQYGDVLFEISHLFGVSVEVLVAIASMENQATETFPAIDILINQSFHHPRDIRYQNELLQALKIIDEGQISPQQLRSNINGKLGKTRFKPTVFRDFAIDFNGDGKYDIWENYADIFASTANYLSNIGWKSGEPWAVQVVLPEEFDLKHININQQKSIDYWQDLEIYQFNGRDLPNINAMGSLIQIDFDKYYLVLDNYFTLLRWKRSQEFAFSIGKLIDTLKPTTSEPDSPSQESPSARLDQTL